jgi:(p)ppGpp synthase/HD superfamily hydrolase
MILFDWYNNFNMTEFLHRAEAIAREAHAGQKYGERDYIEAHVQPIATIIRRLGYGAIYQATGWLHDTIEDTDVTAGYLLSEGIPTEVVHAVNLLTKQPDVDHAAYLDGIITDKYATVAKFADSSANFSSTMLLSPRIKDEKLRAWSLEYAANLAFLQPYLPDPE